MEPSIALGFATPDEPWHLISSLFPDKIGGRPAWLSLKHLPRPKELLCPTCFEPMIFLLQVYCPIEERDDCFHRFIFLFMCLKGACHKHNEQLPFAAFRSQIPRKNPYFSFEPPQNENPTLDEVLFLVGTKHLPCAELYNSICPICGCKADKICSRCRTVHYCSKMHQLVHWKEHKAACGSRENPNALGPNFSSNNCLLPEYRLSSEAVNNSIDESDTSEDEDQSNIDTAGLEEGDEMLELLAKHETKEERRFRKFKEIMSPEPSQVVRFGGSPFWLIKPVPSIGNCEACGSERKFAFQVTPQLLNYLKLDKLGEVSPDFGSLYVFVCSESCPLPRTVACGEHGDTQPEVIEYQRELIIRQLIP